MASGVNCIASTTPMGPSEWPEKAALLLPQLATLTLRCSGFAKCDAVYGKGISKPGCNIPHTNITRSPESSEKLQYSGGFNSRWPASRDPTITPATNQKLLRSKQIWH